MLRCYKTLSKMWAATEAWRPLSAWGRFVTVLHHKTYPTFASVIDNINICVCRQLSATDNCNKVQEELFCICCYQLIYGNLWYMYMQMFQRHYFYHVHLRKVFVVNCSTQSTILTAIIFYCVLFWEKLKLFMVDRIE